MINNSTRKTIRSTQRIMFNTTRRLTQQQQQQQEQLVSHKTITPSVKEKVILDQDRKRIYEYSITLF
jgi:hypothetical protein